MNHKLADFLGLDRSGLEENAPDFFGGRTLPPGAFPIAQAYAGHQYAHLTMLGDGRALLLGEQLAPDGSRHDVHLKGSGRTAFSRRGDGKAALGPMLREFLISEAMAALGIPTTRALAVVATGETVMREDPLPGAVLVRTAASHIRVGTFEYAARCGNPDAVRALVDHTLHRHFSTEQAGSTPALRLLEIVVGRQAALLARWMAAGFVHGVMNTDNMALSGETIDYGPCAFLDAYDPDAVFSSIDRHARYSYRNQPHIAQWNLARLAECLLREIDPVEEKAVAFANEALGQFQHAYEKAFHSQMLAKLGFLEPLDECDEASRLLVELLEWMQKNRADFAVTFRFLCDPAFEKHLPGAAAGNEFQNWLKRYRSVLFRDAEKKEEILQKMRLANPAVIPRNHIVFEVLHDAEAHGDMTGFFDLLEALRNPFEIPVQSGRFCEPPAPDSPRIVTYCGT